MPYQGEGVNEADMEALTVPGGEAMPQPEDATDTELQWWEDNNLALLFRLMARNWQLLLIAMLVAGIGYLVYQWGAEKVHQLRRRIQLATVSRVMVVGDSLKVQVSASHRDPLSKESIRLQLMQHDGRLSPVDPASAAVLQVAVRKEPEALELSLGPVFSPGSYVVQYVLHNGSVGAVSQSVSVQLPSVSVVGAEDPLRWREPVTVQFTSSLSHAGDIVALQLVSNGEAVQQCTVPVPPEASGSITFAGDQAPTVPGVYEFIYLSAKLPSVQVASEQFTVAGPEVLLMHTPNELGPAVGAGAGVPTTEGLPTVFWGEALHVAVHTSAKHHRRDYVLLASVPQPTGAEGAYPEGPQTTSLHKIDQALSDLTKAPKGKKYVWVPAGTSSDLVFAHHACPDKPGVYVLLYVDGSTNKRTVLGRSPAFHVHGPQLTWRAAHSMGSAGCTNGNEDAFWLEPLVAHIVCSSARSSYDTVSLCREGERPATQTTAGCSHYVPLPRDDNPLEDPHIVEVLFDGNKVPQRPGSYRLAYMIGGDASTAVFSPPFLVRGPALDLTLGGPGMSLEPAGMNPSLRLGGFWGESAGVVFETSPRHKSDIIALSYEGELQVAFGAAILGYPRGKFLRVPDIVHRGTLHFEGDLAPQVPGTWQFVYFAQIRGVSTELARSPGFVVRGPSVDVSLACEGVGPGDGSSTFVTPPSILAAFNSSPCHSTSDWLGVSRRGGEPNQGATRGCYLYVPNSPTGNVVFPAKYLPNQRGEYEICYVQASTKKIIARSNVFLINVSPQGEVSAGLAPRPAPEVTRQWSSNSTGSGTINLDPDMLSAGVTRGRSHSRHSDSGKSKHQPAGQSGATQPRRHSPPPPRSPSPASRSPVPRSPSPSPRRSPQFKRTHSSTSTAPARPVSRPRDSTVAASIPAGLPHLKHASSSASPVATTPPAPPGSPSDERKDPGMDLGPYMKMKKFGVPMPAVRTKMMQNGLSEADIAVALAHVFPGEATAMAPRPAAPAPRPASRAPKSTNQARPQGLDMSTLAAQLNANKAKLGKKPRSSGGRRDDRGAGAPASDDPTVIHVSGKRQQAVEIAMRQFRPLRRDKDPGRTITAAIMAGSLEPIGGDPAILLNLMPAADELSMCAQYNGPPEKLRKVPRMLWHLSKLPRAGVKVNAIMFVQAFAGLAHEVRSALQRVHQACGAVINSRKLAAICAGLTKELGLASGGAALAALADLQRLRNPSTIPADSTRAPPLSAIDEFVLKLVTKQGDDGLLDLQAELTLVSDGADVTLHGIRSEVASLKRQCQQALKEAKESTSDADLSGFVRVITNACTQVVPAELQALQTSIDDLEEPVRTLNSLFGQQPGRPSLPAERILGQVRTFCRTWSSAIPAARRRHRGLLARQARKPGRNATTKRDSGGQNRALDMAAALRKRRRATGGADDDTSSDDDN